jgi:fatty acid desaturase
MTGAEAASIAKRRPDTLSVLVVASHAAFTYSPVYLAAIVGPGPSLVVFWLWFGLCQNGLINLMHECAHHLVFKRRWGNELLGKYVLAPLVLTNFAKYRERHWEHHRQLGTDRDPKVVYRTSIRGSRIVALVGRCLVGVEAIRRLTERPAAQPDEADAAMKGAPPSGAVVLVQGLFIGSLAAASLGAHHDVRAALLSAGVAYCFVYGYGVASVTVLTAALRAIAEHHVEPGDVCRRDGDAALRNLRCNALTRLFLGAYGFGEHATHHLHPAVPYYLLPALTKDLAAADETLAIGPGYIATLRRLVGSR